MERGIGTSKDIHVQGNNTNNINTRKALINLKALFENKIRIYEPKKGEVGCP
jgi:hypothetical protein